MPSRSNLPAALLAAAALLWTGAHGSAVAQQSPPVEWRFAFVAPQKSVWGMQLDRWAAAVAEESNGTVKIVNYFGGQLGGEAEIAQQVGRGRLDGGGVGLYALSTLAPELEALTLPAYFTSPAVLDCALDSSLAAPVSKRLARRGVHFLGFGDGGTIHLVGKRSFAAVGDLAGIKAGSYGSRGEQRLWEALRANVAPVSGPEVTSAFQTGLIDAAHVATAFYVAAGINKVAPVLTRGTGRFATALVVNKAAWDRLGADQRAAVERAQARYPLAQLRDEVRSLEAQLLAAHEKGGGKIVERTPEQAAAYRAAVSSTWPKTLADAGPDAPALFAEVEAARAACERKS
jgi:TRAP-type C4-dicarboxylate transport system substrate-binding protein